MTKFLPLTFFITLISLASLTDARDVGGILRFSMIWDKADSPIVVRSDVVVSKGVTLEIKPGVEVKFKVSRSQ